jgi:CubicO group peptidase (beta-lactamase class C family)
MKRIPVLILLAQLFLANYTIHAQRLSSDQIDSIVTKSMEMMPQVGIAVAVIQDGKVVHSKGYGLTSIASKKKVDENTLFAIASNSKSFTAAALAILVDEGKLNWDDKVVEHIPEFKMYDSYVTANFNIKDLLTHRSGLGLGAGDLLHWPGGTNSTMDDILNSFQYLKPVSAFRTKYDYDNLMYIVAGEVVARVSGKSWAEFVKTKIMIPLGMNRSSFMNESSKDKSNIALPHSSSKGKLKELSEFGDPQGLINAAGGIYSSVNDMTKWLLLQLNEGKYGDQLSEELISKINHNEMWKPQTNLGFNAKPTSSYKTHFQAYGLGWGVSDRNGYVNLEHTGGLPGMLSSTLLIPELNVGVVVLTNSDPGGYSFWTIRAEILDAYIGADRKDWISEAKKWIEEDESAGDSVLTAVWDIASNSKIDQLDFNDYIGTYHDNWFGDIEISLRDEKLWFQSMKSPQLNGEMFYYQATTFAIKMEYTDMSCDAFAIFNLDENGKAINMKMKGISPNIDFSFDYQDLDLNRIDK